MPDKLWTDLCLRLATEDDPNKFRGLTDEFFLRVEDRERELRTRKTEETWKSKSVSA